MFLLTLLELSGCATKYISDVKLYEPFSYETRIDIQIIGTVPFMGMQYKHPTNDIKIAIEDDLRVNVFPNIVNVNSDILVEVCVQSLSYNWLTTQAKASILLKIITKDGFCIKSYSNSGYDNNHPHPGVINSIKNVMEKIKYDIIRDRDAIVAAIEGKKKPYEVPKEITKPMEVSKPPNLTFSYSLLDENGDKILDGGERVSLKVIVRNQGEGPAQGVKVLLSGSSEALNYLGREKSLGDIPADGEKKAIFEAILPYQIDPDEGVIIIKVSEVQGFGSLEVKKLRVAMQPATEKVETEVVSVLIDVDQPLPPSYFKRKDAYAVIIGITNYRSNKIPEITYAKNDAETVKEYVINICGIPEENIISLVDDRATLSDLTAYIEEWLARNVSKNSFVFVYFAGHGTPNPQKGDAYLVPYDGEPGFISKLYPLSRFYSSLEKLPTDNIIVALDACFSGAGSRSVMEKGKRPLVPVKMPGETDKITVITASAADEISQDLDTKKHGLFTYYFLKGLRGEADANSDGWITLGELHNYCKPNIADESRRLGYTQTVQVSPQPLGEKANLRIGKLK